MLDFVAIVQNLSQVVTKDGALWSMVSTFCYAMAFILALATAFQLKDVAEQGKMTYRTPIFTFVAATLMAAVPSAILSVAETVYGNMLNGSPLSYVKSGQENTSFVAVLHVISFIGYVFFVRGILILKQAGQPERFHHASVGKAIVTLTSGMCAIYIDMTLKVVSGITGWNISNYIN